MSLKDKCIASHILTDFKLMNDKSLTDVKYKRFGNIFEMCLYFNIKTSKDIWRIKILASKESQYMGCKLKEERMVLSFYAPSKYVDLLTVLNNDNYPLYNNTLIQEKTPGS